MRRHGDPSRAVQEKAYLKSDMRFLGAGVPAIRNAVRSVRQANPDLDRSTVLQAVEMQWRKPVFELRLAAVLLLEAFEQRLEAADLGFLERLIVESKTWALVDDLAIAVVGGLVERNRQLALALDAWSTGPNFWLRRAAMLALLGPLRRGSGDFDRFSRYADAMLEQREFFIRKAIGWVLRETSKRRPALVYEWILPRAGRASGVTIREAVKYLSPAQRDAILNMRDVAGEASRSARVHKIPSATRGSAAAPRREQRP